MFVLYRRRWGLFYLPVLALAAGVVWLALQHAFALPPRSLTIAAGSPQGGYVRLAERYRDELELLGISVDIATSAASTSGPLQRLANPLDAAQAGFAPGLLSDRGPEAPVEALAVIGKEPVWVFTHQSAVVSQGMLRGLRIAAGPPGSPTRTVARLLLAQSQVREADVTWDDSEGLKAAAELLEQRVDAAFVIGGGDAPAVRELTQARGISMVGLERANALAAREPRLQPFVLPQGTIELRGDVPARDVTMLYTGTHLLVRESLHPALQRALLDAATEIHATPSPLQRQAEYPEFRTDFPLSPVAQRYAAGYRPWLERALPYWWAQLAELLLYVVLPVTVLTGLALLWIPQLFSLRVNAVLSHYYGELMFIEQDIESVAADSPIDLKTLLNRLDTMEQSVAALDLPDDYADRWYTLREHLAAARERLLKLRAR